MDEVKSNNRLLIQQDHLLVDLIDVDQLLGRVNLDDGDVRPILLAEYADDFRGKVENRVLKDLESEIGRWTREHHAYFVSSIRLAMHEYAFIYSWNQLLSGSFSRDYEKLLVYLRGVKDAFFKDQRNKLNRATNIFVDEILTRNPRLSAAINLRSEVLVALEKNQSAHSSEYLKLSSLVTDIHNSDYSLAKMFLDVPMDYGIALDNQGERLSYYVLRNSEHSADIKTVQNEVMKRGLDISLSDLWSGAGDTKINQLMQASSILI